MAKEITWRGLTEASAMKLDLARFMELAGTRPRRTLKKGFTEAQKKLLHRLEADEKNIKTHCRDMVILPQMLGKTIKVHNGKEFLPVMITLEMLGHYLGEFSHTRKGVTHSSAGIGATRSSKAISAR